MSRTCMHLLAWVSVAALFFANTHTSSALTVLLRRPPSSPPTQGKRSCCSHCQARKAKPAAPATSHTTVTAKDSDHRSCPCCPAPEPCPDNCALCGVAKTLVTVTTPVDCEPAPQLSETWTDAVFLHITNFSRELMRPPRA